MVSLNSVDSPACCICGGTALPIHGHRNGWGMLNRHPFLGIEFPAYQKLWRLAGVDQMHVNGLANKFWESDDSVVRSIEACLKPMFRGGRARMMPVISSGQMGRAGPGDLPADGSTDLMYWPAAGSWRTPAASAGRRASICARPGRRRVQGSRSTIRPRTPRARQARNLERFQLCGSEA